MQLIVARRRTAPMHSRKSKTTIALSWLAAAYVVCFPSLSVAQQGVLPPDIGPPRSQMEDFGKPLGTTEGIGIRSLEVLAQELIKEFERWMPAAYDDPVGYCTIGYGHLIALQRCSETSLGGFSEPLSVKSGAELLNKDTVQPRRVIQKLVTVDLTDDQFGALTSFVFNIGENKFANSSLLRILNYGAYDRAIKEFPRWVISRGVIQNGLVERRTCEAALFRGVLTLEKDGHFSRSQCASSLGAAPPSGPLIDIDVGEQQQ